MKTKKQYETPQLSFIDFCEGMGSDGRELSMLGQKKWDLVKLYLTTRLKEGGQFTYEDLAKRAVRFACIVSNTIEGMREDLHKEYLQAIKREEEEKKEREREKEEEERRVRLTPMERYREGLPVRYENLDESAKEEVYKKYLELQRKGIGHVRGSSSIHWRDVVHFIGKVELLDSEFDDFERKKDEMVSSLPPFKRAQWGWKVEWGELNEEDRQTLYRNFLGGDRKHWCLGKEKKLVNYHNYIIPKVLIDAWREEYNQKKKEGRQ